ncbi:hypothetical protein NA57DRAFT_66538 [Rhizodiscina lignyota]|uniref:Xylanolytic transcriptional activator regulatory domain-containing protein n=1 Tax=Rhizodiscina lignyota TaxID=1504668 RepID=A0A9P4IFD4_9PEZI|nr:hypothetical protein NA57DRAFT_66538 [Rhizodiscina lignyota]
MTPQMPHSGVVSESSKVDNAMLPGSTAQSSGNSPEPLQSDQQGHFVGPASGASFLLRIQRNLLRQQSSISSESSIFTFGDLPLPEFDPSFVILPNKSDAEALVARYFEFASATHRFLHRPTVEQWLQELYTDGAMRHKPSARSRTALLFMVFAQARVYQKPSLSDEIDSGARLFSAAEHQLAAERGAIRLTSVQARVAQCLYLLAQSRINHCWSLFGTTSHLVLALGIHRKQRGINRSNMDYIDLECRRRTFWCAYNIDTYLSAALGRPRTFHDDDIDQAMPSCVNDEDLHTRHMNPSPLPSQSTMSGCTAHIDLSRILANILRDLYGIKQPSFETRLSLSDKYEQDLQNWRRDLLYLLDTSGIDPSMFLPIFLRQRNVLNLAFWHAQILVHRPFLLSTFAGGSKSAMNESPEVNRHVRQCLNAALNIVDHVHRMSSTGQLYSSYWFTQYFSFCAVVVLYVYSMQQPASFSEEDYRNAFEAGARCQEQLSDIAAKGSLAERYGVVLQELRLEVLKHASFTQNTIGPQTAGPNHGRSLQQVPEQRLGMFHQGPSDTFLSTSPTGSIGGVTGWGQFDSLVTGGLAELESFMTDGNDGALWDFGISA